MSALTLCAFKHVNSSSKSFVTRSRQGRPLGPQLFDGCNALIGCQLPPELTVGRAFFGKRGTPADPHFHRVIIANLPMTTSPAGAQ
jgi:hypothetical protein